MKTQNGFLSENWTFKRALRVSIKIALLFAVFNIIWILIFGAKSEIVVNLKLTEEITKIITLPWNSWFKVIPNSIGFFIFGISLWGILNFFNYQIEKGNIQKEGLTFGLTLVLALGLVVGFAVGLTFGLALVLAVGLALGLIFGLACLLNILFSKKFWKKIGKGIVWFWKMLTK